MEIIREDHGDAMIYHEPVLLQEATEALRITKGKRYIDATFGGGGHTKQILELGGTVLSLDTDADAAKEAQQIRNKNFTFVRGNFRDINTLAQSHGFYPVDGILFDLGVSSHQLNTADRGFSYRYTDAPLDLRLNQEEGVSAKEYLAYATKEELIHIFTAFGEEESGGIIAHALCRTRSVKPIETTGDLYNIIEETVGKGRAKETASRVFQALRIEINDEFGSLKQGLEGAATLLSSNGRLVVISFHSLEDRIVKKFLSSGAWHVVKKKPVTPTREEEERNKRARSAKMRVGEKI